MRRLWRWAKAWWLWKTRYQPRLRKAPKTTSINDALKLFYPPFE